MRKIGFRTRLLIVLALFAVIPSLVLTIAYSWSATLALRELSGTEPWERAAESGLAALDAADRYDLSAEDRQKVRAHREQLSQSLTRARQLGVLARTAPTVAIVFASAALLIVGMATTRVAGHLSRQLSRPLQELVQWTEMMARGEVLPEMAQARGAPEFEVLRQRMRRTARELHRSRERALEAERLRAFRESARQVAHELKNLLTPIRFAVARLQRDASPSQADTIEVLETETRRIEEIARDFALFGKLPEGPAADIDVAEMVTYSARTIVPEEMSLEVTTQSGLPHVHGHHDALSRALSNVLLNAVDACRDGGGISVHVRRASESDDCIEIVVADSGHGIEPGKLASIWEPYVTYKSGGTGLGLAIAKQTIEAHGGTVAATSTPGSGTVITFLLPVSGAKSVSRSRSPAAGVNSQA
jgi:signal transduction histidine kinase